MEVDKYTTARGELGHDCFGPCTLIYKGDVESYKRLCECVSMILIIYVGSISQDCYYLIHIRIYTRYTDTNGAT